MKVPNYRKNFVEGRREFVWNWGFNFEQLLNAKDMQEVAMYSDRLWTLSLLARYFGFEQSILLLAYRRLHRSQVLRFM